MSTAISEFDTTGTDLAFEMIPRVLPARVGPVHRSGVDVVRGGGDEVALRRGGEVALRRARGAGRPMVGHAWAEHPEDRVERAQLGFAALAVAALLTAVVVTGLIGIAHLRAGALIDGRTAVVQVEDSSSSSGSGAGVAHR